MSELHIEWHTTPEKAQDTNQALIDEGAPIRKGLGFEPMTVISIAIAVAPLIKSLVKLYQQSKYKGVIIDTTRDPIEIREMPGWSSKKVLLITEEG